MPGAYGSVEPIGSGAWLPAVAADPIGWPKRPTPRPHPLFGRTRPFSIVTPRPDQGLAGIAEARHQGASGAVVDLSAGADDAALLGAADPAARPAPTLDDALDMLPDGLRLFVRPVSEHAAFLLARTIRRRNAWRVVAVAPVPDARLLWLRRVLGPGVCAPATLWEVAHLRLTGRLPPMAEGPPAFIQAPEHWLALPVVIPGLISAAAEDHVPVLIELPAQGEPAATLLQAGAIGTVRPAPARTI